MTAQDARPLRLAIVRQAYNPFGGAERFVERALAALGKEALEVTLLTRKWQGEAQPGLHVLQLRAVKAGRLLRDWSFARAVQACVKEQAFDLVQSHERIPGCDIFRAGDGVHATWLDLRARTLGPLARLGQRLSPWHRFILSQERQMFEDPALRAVICNSRMVRDDIARRHPRLADRLHVIHNGTDLERFHPGLREQHRATLRASLGVPESRPVLLHVGSGFERKGVPALIEAMAHPELAAAELWIVGRDRQESRLRARAARLGVAGRIRFCGPQQDVTPWLGAADAFVLPTLYDPMPNAAMEALASGLPVLSSTSSGAAELITPGVNGECVDALDIAAIVGKAAKMLAAMQDPEKSVAIRIAARKSVAEMSKEAMAVQLVALYRQLMARVSPL
ncbi:glycosyltransferase family 4 protein [Uliginosibacterium paludis]|uniref:Glycosyltransferase family 4 protein n=1 Tax=Uliginosibacterium paludis TaxID=1615952 RepID=A0ABV2CWI2_9RHOO